MKDGAGIHFSVSYITGTKNKREFEFRIYDKSNKVRSKIFLDEAQATWLKDHLEMYLRDIKTEPKKED